MRHFTGQICILGPQAGKVLQARRQLGDLLFQQIDLAAGQFGFALHATNGHGQFGVDAVTNQFLSRMGCGDLGMGLGHVAQKLRGLDLRSGEAFFQLGQGRLRREQLAGSAEERLRILLRLLEQLQ